MKLLFNLCLAAFVLLPFKRSYGREIILVENRATADQGLMLRKILEAKFRLPRSLITLKNIQSECDQKSEAIIHLCLLPDGDLKVIKMNQFVVKNSFGIFLNQEEIRE